MELRDWRPRVKPEHTPYRVADGTVRIGGSAYGVAAEVADRTGAVWAMLEAADGRRSPDEIAAAVVDAYPGETTEAVHRALELFVRSGYLEDAAAADPEELSPRERERYGRSRMFYRWIDLVPGATGWESQLRLKRARVVVLGLGGTGGAAATALAASGVGRLHCIDGDLVELSNLNRQTLYGEADVGSPKVEAAVRALRALNSDIEITGERRTVRRAEDFDSVVDDCDVFLLCADRPGEIRSWANRACLAMGVPWVESGYHGPVVTAAAYVPGAGPCYECTWLAEYDRHRESDPTAEYSVARRTRNAVVAVTAGLSGHLAAHLALAIVGGVPRVEPGQMRGLNLIAPDQHFLLDYRRRPDCPACGTGR